MGCTLDGFSFHFHRTPRQSTSFSLVLQLDQNVVGVVSVPKFPNPHREDEFGHFFQTRRCGKKCKSISLWIAPRAHPSHGPSFPSTDGLTDVYAPKCPVNVRSVTFLQSLFQSLNGAVPRVIDKYRRIHRERATVLRLPNDSPTELAFYQKSSNLLGKR